MQFAALWLDPKNVILSKVSQTEKDNKNGYNLTYPQNRNRVRDVVNELMITRG